MIRPDALARLVAGREVLACMKMKGPQPAGAKPFLGGCRGCKGDVWIQPASALLVVERDLVVLCIECLGVD